MTSKLLYSILRDINLLQLKMFIIITFYFFKEKNLWYKYIYIFSLWQHC